MFVHPDDYYTQYLILKLVSYLFKSPDDYALSKSVNVALWLDYPAFNNQELLTDAIDFIIVNNHSHDEFDAFKRDEEIESEYSYLRMNELLMYYINHECGHLQQRIVTRYGHTYLKLSGYDVDDLCVWIKRRRESDLIGEDLFAGIYTLTAV